MLALHCLNTTALFSHLGNVLQLSLLVCMLMSNFSLIITKLTATPRIEQGLSLALCSVVVATSCHVIIAISTGRSGAASFAKGRGIRVSQVDLNHDGVLFHPLF